MKERLRITLDTNILISAMFWNGFPKAILKKCREGEAKLILSKEIVEELKDVLRKERKFGMTARKILDREKTLLEIAELVTPTKRLDVIRADEKDNRILECGVAGKVDFIVSGDKHLLNLSNYGKIKIITARKLVEMLETTYSSTPLIL